VSESARPWAAGDREPLLVTLAGDDELVRAGLATMLAPLAHRAVLIEEPTTPVDVVLIDPFRVGGPGLDALRELAETGPAKFVGVYTYRRDPALVDAAMAAGATGYLSKASGATDLVEELERMAAGERVVPAALPGEDRPPYLARWALTERESDVADLLARGWRNADIAGALGISLNTVKTHLRALFRKLGVKTRAQAVVLVLGARTDQELHDAPSAPRQ
jgi:two-component system, NarL family, response regulator LiaR